MCTAPSWNDSWNANYNLFPILKISDIKWVNRLLFTLFNSIPYNRIFFWWIDIELFFFKKSSNVDLLSLETILRTLLCKWLIRVFEDLWQNIQNNGQYANCMICLHSLNAGCKGWTQSPAVTFCFIYFYFLTL